MKSKKRFEKQTFKCSKNDPNTPNAVSDLAYRPVAAHQQLQPICTQVAKVDCYYPYQQANVPIADSYDEFIDRFPLAKDPDYITCLLAPPVYSKKGKPSCLGIKDTVIIRRAYLHQLLQIGFPLQLSMGIRKADEKRRKKPEVIFSEGLLLEVDESLFSAVVTQDLLYEYGLGQHAIFATKPGQLGLLFLLDQPIADIKVYNHLINRLITLFKAGKGYKAPHSNIVLKGYQTKTAKLPKPIHPILIIDALSYKLHRQELKRCQAEAYYMQNCDHEGSALYNIIPSKAPSRWSHLGPLLPAKVRFELEQRNFLKEKVKELLSVSTSKTDAPTHPVWFWLASNLVPLKGGKKIYNDLLNMHPTVDKKDKIALFNYISNRLEGPMPYYPIGWKYLPDKYLQSDMARLLMANYDNLLQVKPHHQYSKAIISELPDNYRTDEEIRKEYQQDFDAVLAQPDGKVHLFILPPGVGKTYYAINKEGILVMLKDHLKIQEKSEECEVDHYFTRKLKVDILPPKLKQQYTALQRVGAIEAASAIRWDFTSGKTYPDPEWDDARAHIKEYHKALSIALKSTKTVLTTHHLGVFVDFSLHPIQVIDEDIIPLLIERFKINTKDLRILAELLKKDGSHIDSQFFEELEKDIRSVDLQDNQIEFDLTKIRDLKKVKSTIINNASSFSGNMLEFLNQINVDLGLADRKDPSGERQIKFVIRRHLHPNKTYLVLSATPYIPLYQQVFGKDKVVIHDYGQVKTKANIIQFSDKTRSKSNLKGNISLVKEIDERAQKHFKVLTFKFLRQHLKNADEIVHFWNDEGFNHLKGQDLIILGTPYPSTDEMILYARALNISFNQSDIELFGNGVIRTTPKECVAYNGVTFNLVSYKNPALRDLQCHLIYSRMYQMLERARTIYYEVNIVVFSEFAIPGARHYYHKDWQHTMDDLIAKMDEKSKIAPENEN
jgi:hypothetical protein